MSLARLSLLILSLLGVVNFFAVAADRLKQFSLVGMVGIYAPGSSFELLQLNLFMQVPMLIFSPLVGVLLDRWNKLAVIVVACVFRAGVILFIPRVFDLSGASLYSLYSVAFVLAIADLAFAPARSAVIPDLVPEDRLLQTNAIFWSVGIVGTLAGVLYGGWIIDFHSWQASFYSDALAYAVAAVTMLPVVVLYRLQMRSQPHPSPPPAKEHAPGPLAGIRIVVHSIADGIALIRDDRTISLSLITQSAMFAIGGIVGVIGIARIQEVAPVGKAFFLSIVAACIVTGLIAGSGLASLFRRTITLERTIAVSALLTGVALTGLGRTETIIPLSIWGGVLGLAMSPAFIITETMIQHQSPRTHLGRMFAAREALVKAAYLAGAALAAAINTVLAKSTILVMLGLFLALSGVLLERTKWLRTEKE